MADKEPLDNPEMGRSEDFRKEIWIKLLRDKTLGKQISEADKRALGIREQSIRVATFLNDLVIDPKPKKSVVDDGVLIAQIWDSLRNLEEQGVKSNMHVGDPPESFDNAPKIAEYVGGQILRMMQRLPLLTSNEVTPELKKAVDRHVTESGAKFGILNSKDISPIMKNFIGISSFINLTDGMLYSDLDHPSEQQGSIGKINPN